MKTIRDFLRKHALLLLAALVVLSVPAGAALGKYVGSVTVTDTLTLNVSMKTYTLDTFVGSTIASECDKAGAVPKTIYFCDKSSVPSGLNPVSGVDLRDKSYALKSGSIYLYIDISNDSVYIAPETNGRMYAPSICSQFLSAHSGTATNKCTRLTEKIVFKNFDTSNVTNMKEMFLDCESLTDVDFSRFDTSKATNMYAMFAGCKSLQSLDVGSLDTSEVTNMSRMFNNCEKITSLSFGENFHTSKVNTMSGMFSGCTSLSTLNLEHFDTSSVTDMSGMFSNCSNLCSIDISSFSTTNVTTMSSMFSGCKKLVSFTFPNLDTSNVATMESMFDSCTGLKTLDLSNLNTENVTNMRQMFSGDSSLITIYVSDKFNVANVTYSGNMFYNCSCLKGENGTSYYWKNTNKTYAHIDGGTANPGYFTDINATRSLTYSATGTDTDANGFSITSNLAS